MILFNKVNQLLLYELHRVLKMVGVHLMQANSAILFNRELPSINTSSKSIIYSSPWRLGLRRGINFRSGGYILSLVVNTVDGGEEAVLSLVW